LVTHKTLGKDLGDSSVDIIYWLGAIITVALLIYLMIALLKPEIFS
jgi:K+-transporting ATPase KdpF subunit